MTELSHRLFVALLLPLDRKLQIDESGLRRLVRYYSKGRLSDVGGLVANPEAGEVFYLTRSEKRRVLDIVLEEVGASMPVLAGAFGWTTREAVQTAEDAKAAGAAGIFCIPPSGAMDVTTSWDADTYPEVWLDQIKEQDRNITAVTLGLGKRLSQMFLERIPVEQSGKDIVISQTEYALLGPFTLRNVAYYCQDLIFTAAHNSPFIIS